MARVTPPLAAQPLKPARVRGPKSGRRGLTMPSWGQWHNHRAYSDDIDELYKFTKCELGRRDNTLSWLVDAIYDLRRKSDKDYEYWSDQHKKARATVDEVYDDSLKAHYKARETVDELRDELRGEFRALRQEVNALKWRVSDLEKQQSNHITSSAWSMPIQHGAWSMPTLPTASFEWKGDAASEMCVDNQPKNAYVTRAEVFDWRADPRCGD